MPGPYRIGRISFPLRVENVVCPVCLAETPGFRICFSENVANVFIQQKLGEHCVDCKNPSRLERLLYEDGTRNRF